MDDGARSDIPIRLVAFEYLPGNNIKAPVKTDFHITFDERYLYMEFRGSDPD